MDDQMNDPMKPDEASPDTEPAMDDPTNPTETAPEADRPHGTGREMLVQLQQMIDTVATQAVPVLREVAAKAAELAAVAGEKAGPLAQRAAGMTESVGQRVAARSKDFAAELRRGGAHESSADEPPTEAGDGTPSG
jgi:hypothetical protein